MRRASFALFVLTIGTLPLAAALATPGSGRAQQPSPTATPAATASPAASPTATPSPAPTPTVSLSPTPIDHCPPPEIAVPGTLCPFFTPTPAVVPNAGGAPSRGGGGNAEAAALAALGGLALAGLGACRFAPRPGRGSSGSDGER